MVAQNSRIPMSSSLSHMFTCLSLTHIWYSYVSIPWSHHHFPLRNSIWVMFVHPAAPMALADQQLSRNPGWSLWPHSHSEIPMKSWAFCVNAVHEPGTSLAPGLGFTSAEKLQGSPVMDLMWPYCTSMQGPTHPCPLEVSDPWTQGTLYPSKQGLRIVWEPQGTLRYLYLQSQMCISWRSKVGGIQGPVVQNC